MYDYRYHFYYGLLFSKLGDYENAEVELKRSLAMNPNFYLGYYELGNLLYLKKEYDDAIQMYLKAFEINKEFSLPLLKMGDAYFENGQFKDAEIAYKTALKVEKLSQIYLRLGVLYNSIQKFEKAEKIFREGLSVEYKPEIAYNLAYTLSRLGKHFQALQVLKELSKNFPSTEVYNELGLEQKLFGMYEEALENLELAGEEYKENYLKVLLFVKGYDESLLRELEKFDPEYVNFLRTLSGEKEEIENRLENMSFPFGELNYSFEITDEIGEVILEELENYIYLTFKEKIGLIISNAYIAGANPILIEKNLARTSLLLFNNDEAISFYKVFQIIYFGRLFEKMLFQEIIERVLQELSKVNVMLFRKAFKLLEEEKKSLDDFWEEYSEPKKLAELTLKLIELLSYEPTKHEINEETLVGKIAKVILSL